MATARRFWTLDALRGICALIVFLSHCHLWSNFEPKGAAETLFHRILDAFHSAFAFLAWPAGGNHPAVICFFVLSGFCIHHGYANATAPGSAPRWGDFYRRRFLRMMPVYWTASLLGFVLVAAMIVHPVDTPYLTLHGQGSQTDMLVRLFAATEFFPREVLAGNAPLNTAATELLIYAIYPVIFLAAARGWWLAMGLAFVAAEAVGLSLLGTVSPYRVYNSILMYGLFWYAGALAAHVHRRIGSRSHALALLLSWVLFLGLNSMPHFYGLGVLRQNAWGLVCVFAVLQCLHLESKWTDWAASRIAGLLQYLGDISYSLYAVHTPVLLLGTWALIQLGVTRYSLQFAATLVASLIVTLVVHHRIERVFYRPRTRVAAAPGHQRAAASTHDALV